MKIQNWAQAYLSKEDLIRIENAVKKIELSTSAEIVPMLVKRSVPSDLVTSKSTILALCLLFLFSSSYVQELDISIYFAMALLIVSFIALLMTNKHEKLYRLVNRKEIRAKHCDNRAEVEFYRNQMQNTKDSTGLLIFMSLWDHHMTILCDPIMNEKFEDGAWEKILKHSLEKVKTEGIASAIVHCIEQIEPKLSKEFPILPDDTNELKNDLIIKE